jgi:hypothetical protein
MNKNKRQPEIKFIEKKHKKFSHYFVEVDGEKIKVSKTAFEREQKKYLRKIKSGK